MHPGARVPRRIEREPERLDHRGADVVGERHLGVRFEVRAEDAEPLVRVDATAAGGAIGLSPSNGSPRRGPADAGRRVPGGPPARRDRRRPPRLPRASRGPSPASRPTRAAPRVSCRRASRRPRRRGHAGGGERDVPGVDLVQRSARARYYVPPWSGSSSPATRRTRASRGSPARSSSVTGCTSPGRRRSRPTAHRSRRAPTSRPPSACASSRRRSRSGLRPRARRPDEHLRHRARALGRGRPGARRGFPRHAPGSHVRRRRAARSGLEGRDRGRGGARVKQGHPGGHHRPRRRRLRGERRRPQVRLE